MVWLDVVRGIAILWIFLVHFVERFLSGSHFANPRLGWPPLAERISQLRPLDIAGIEGFLANTLRYVGWLGDQGVQIFLVASGFGLALSAIYRSERGSEVGARSFYIRRLGRLLPQWWAAHIGFIAAGVLLGVGMPLLNWRTIASFLGLRFLPQVMYFFSPAWWYIGVLLQLYLVFPLLFRLLQRTSLLRFLAIVGGAAIVLRGAGLFAFDAWAPQLLDWWSRGAVFIARLPEFAFGMAFAKLYHERREIADRLTRTPWAVAAWAAVYVAGNILSFTMAGMAIAFLMTGAAVFALLYAACANCRYRRIGPLQWAGRKSYPLFLVHHPVINVLVPAALAVAAIPRVLFYLLIAAGASLMLGLVLERVTGLAEGWLRAWNARVGTRGIALRAAGALVVLVVILYSAEFLVRKYNPQEVYGWGERPALRQHDELGYTLKPDSVTRLRWQSYDYLVEANRLGFPGALHSETKPAEATRILVTGDAFASAEGVDTDRSWPRLLEKRLKEAGVHAEVLNFSITGWGPQHYARAVSRFAPAYEPDLIVVSFFINEYVDVLTSDEDFKRSIGFGEPPHDSVRGIATLKHLREWNQNVLRPAIRGLLGRDSGGLNYFLGQFAFIERQRLPEMEQASDAVRRHLETIQATADQIGAGVLVAMVPSGPQVAPPHQLDYFPSNMDLSDESRFDMDQPQRLTRQICTDLGLACVDLREPLRDAVERRPYQPRNMHWTEAGHEIVADFLAALITARD
jgi:peptidoglycan/LPS O-acetylase OafA/YrhL